MNRTQAHRGQPLAMLPNYRPIYESDLDLTISERLGLWLRWALVALVLTGVLLLLSLPGN